MCTVQSQESHRRLKIGLGKEGDLDLPPAKVAAVEINVRLHRRRLLCKLHKDSYGLLLWCGRSRRQLDDPHLMHLAEFGALLANLILELLVDLTRAEWTITPVAESVFFATSGVRMP